MRLVPLAVGLLVACTDPADPALKERLCTPASCAEVAACGVLEDGCGGVLDCGACDGGLACVGGACVSQCPSTTCEEDSCGVVPSVDASCPHADCGTCSPEDYCGTDNRCHDAVTAGVTAVDVIPTAEGHRLGAGVMLASGDLVLPVFSVDGPTKILRMDAAHRQRLVSEYAGGAAEVRLFGEGNSAYAGVAEYSSIAFSGGEPPSSRGTHLVRWDALGQVQTVSRPSGGNGAFALDPSGTRIASLSFPPPMQSGDDYVHCTDYASGVSWSRPIQGDWEDFRGLLVVSHSSFLTDGSLLFGGFTLGDFTMDGQQFTAEPGTPFVLSLDPDTSRLRWARVLSPVSGYVEALERDGDGFAVMVRGTAGRTFTWGDFTSEIPAGNGDALFVARGAADGAPRSALAVGKYVGPGSFVAFDERVVVFANVFKDGCERSHVAAYDANGTLWTRELLPRLCSQDSSTVHVNDLHLAPDGNLVMTGNFYGRMRTTAGEVSAGDASEGFILWMNR